MKNKVVIVVQQETLKERPRIHKLAKVLAGMSVPFEIWKFGETAVESVDGIQIRNLMNSRWLKRHALLRYLNWMLHVHLSAWRERHHTMFFAVGFDSAAPLALLPIRRPTYIFDNIDNVSMSYRWPTILRSVFSALEVWVARRAQLHVNPSRQRWKYQDANLRVVTNTPSKETLTEARALAGTANIPMIRPFTIYLNGWLSPTRGIRTLINSLQTMNRDAGDLVVLVAGRAGCEDAKVLLTLPNVKYLGMLSNAEALAAYYRSDLAFIYYDPGIEINRLAESQKWTDCWATNTAFVSNCEIETLTPYVAARACLTCAYDDSVGLASLLEALLRDRSQLTRVRQSLSRMNFRFWDEEMRLVMKEWFEINDYDFGTDASLTR